MTNEKLQETVAWLCEKVHGIEMRLPGSRPELFLPVRCATSLGKNELAQLFYILMDEQIIFFDIHEPHKNRSLLQQFIQKNFTYCRDGAIQTPINSISKEFSEAKGYTYRDKQFHFLDKMIRILQERRQRMPGK